MGEFLVTGAAGFIGAAVANSIISSGHHVVTIDNLSTGFIENIPKKCESIIGDAHDANVIAKLNNRKFEAIYHIAGQSGGIPSFDDPIYDMNANIASTLLLLRYAKENNCNRFIYTSSMSVYGDENKCPVSENAELKPKSFYAVGKMASENYLRLYSDYGIRTTALRVNNVYGPGQNLKNLNQGMVSIFIAQAINNKHIHVMGAKERFRDFVFIDDVVEAIIMCGNDYNQNGYNVYNIATGIKTTVEKLVMTILDSLPFEVTVEYEGSTPGDQYGIYCDYKNINASLDWTPKVHLADGIKYMVNWALS